MKKLQRITALILCVLMLFPTQAATTLADTFADEPAEVQIIDEEGSADEIVIDDDASGDERIEETMPLEPIEDGSDTDERIDETMPLEPIEGSSDTDERIEETLPLEPLENTIPKTETAAGNTAEKKASSLEGVTAVYWNPGGSLPADLLASPSNAAADNTAGTTTEGTASDADKTPASDIVQAASPSNADTAADMAAAGTGVFGADEETDEDMDIQLASASNSSNKTSGKTSSGKTDKIADGDDNADGFSAKHPVKSLETAFEQIDKLAEATGVDRADIVIYAMNPLEIPSGQMYAINAGNTAIESWPGRPYDNDTIFYINGGHLTLMNALLQPGEGATDTEEAEMIRVNGGVLQLGQNVQVEGRIVMDYTHSNEKTEWEQAWETASASNADMSVSNADASVTVTDTADSTADADTADNTADDNAADDNTSDTSSGFDINDYVLSTSEDEWEVQEDKREAGTWRESIIELLDGFNGAEQGLLLELRSDEDREGITLARTLYADEAPAEEFADYFRLAGDDEGEWNLIPATETTATVRDTGAEDLARFRSMMSLMTLEEDADEDSAIGSDISAPAMTVKLLAAERAAGGNTVYWNPGPSFVFGGQLYSAGSDENNSGFDSTRPLKTLSKAITQASGGTIIVMQQKPLELKDGAEEYLDIPQESGAWVVKGTSDTVIPTLKVWNVNQQAFFRVPSGEELILENINLEGLAKDGDVVESEAVIVEAGADVVVRGHVTAETGYIGLKATDVLKDHPVHAKSTEDVNVTLFFSGINNGLDSRYVDVVKYEAGNPTTDDDKEAAGQALLGCYSLAKSHKLIANGGSSRFDWTLRQDGIEDDEVYNPQNLELYAPYYYDAIYLDGVRGNDVTLGATCEYPVKTWERARKLWETEMTRSMDARKALRDANLGISIPREEMDEQIPYPKVIYICGTVKVADTESWSLEAVEDYDGSKAASRVESHHPVIAQGAEAAPHELPDTLVKVEGSGNLTLEDIAIYNNTDISKSRTILVTGENASLTVKGGVLMSGALEAGYQQEEKKFTRGTHIEADYGATVLLDERGAFDESVIETRQQGIVASGAGTTVTMKSGIIRKHVVYVKDLYALETKRGAGVSITGGASMTMDGGSISENETYDYGGGVYVDGAGSSFTMNKGTIANNRVEIARRKNEKGYGVGVYGGAGTVLTIGTADGDPADAVISGSVGYIARGTGIYSNGTLKVNKATITGNRADCTGNGYYSASSGNTDYMPRGVGIYVGADGTLEMDGAVITDNKVIAPNANGLEHAYGAGICIESNDSGKTNVIKNSTISGNVVGYSNTSGGATSTGSTFSRGGGIYCEGASKLEMSDCVISENRALSGAGIHLAGSGGVNITQCTISGNIASSSKTNETPAANGYGGGVFIYFTSKAVSALFTDCTIDSNQCSSYYGALQITRGTVRLIGSAPDKMKITQNSGMGIYLYSSYSILSGENVLISENTGGANGGGMMVGAVVYLKNSRITGNKASEGGGARIISGEAYFQDVQVTDNEASQSGGGIAHIGGNFYWTESKPGASRLTGNRAQNGGGIYKKSGEAVIRFSAPIQNTATLQGSNIYVSNKGTNSGVHVIRLLEGTLAQPDPAVSGVYNVYLSTDGVKFIMDPQKVSIEHREGTDAVYLNTASSALTYLQEPPTGAAKTLPIDVNKDVFKVGSVLVRPADANAVYVYSPNSGLSGTESETVSYTALKNASFNMEYEEGGKLPRRMSMGAFRDESDDKLTNVVLVGEGVYLAGTDSGGDDTNHHGTSPDDAVATFARAKAVLEQNIAAKRLVEKDKPEEEQEGYSPYIYICGNVPIGSGETWEMDYTDTLYTVDNAAFARAEISADPALNENPESLQPQVRRFASFVTAPMITVNAGSSFTVDKLIVDGVAEAVNIDIQKDKSPIVYTLGGAAVTLNGEAQLRNNYSIGIQLLGDGGKLLLSGGENETNRQLANISGDYVRMSGKQTAVEMSGAAGLVRDKASVGSATVKGINMETNAAGATVTMKDSSAITGAEAFRFNHGIGTTGRDQIIELQDTSGIAYTTYGIYLNGHDSEVRMNQHDGAEDSDSAQISYANTGGIYIGNDGNKILMGKQSKIHSGNYGIYVNGNTTSSDPNIITMSEHSAVTGNSNDGIYMKYGYALDITLKDSAKITRNNRYGIAEDTTNSNPGYGISRLNVLLQNDARISANRSRGIYLGGTRTLYMDNGDYQTITLKDRAIIGGPVTYTADKSVEDCGNGSWGIQVSGPVRIHLQDDAALRYNSGGIWCNPSSYSVTYRKGVGEVLMEGNSEIFGITTSYGIHVSTYTYNTRTDNPVNVTLRDNASVQYQGAQIQNDKTGDIRLEGNARVWCPNSMDRAVDTRGTLYLDGSATVEGHIILEDPAKPIVLTGPVAPSDKTYKLRLIDGFVGKEVVIPVGNGILANAVPFLPNFENVSTATIAKTKRLVAIKPNIVLEGENNVFLSGTGNDVNDGNSPATAVRTFHRAKELLQTGSFTAGANILISGSLTVGEWKDEDGSTHFDGDWSFESGGTITNTRTGDTWTPMVQLYQNLNDYMIKVPSNKEVTFRDIVIDGNKKKINTARSMLYLSTGSTVNIQDGAIFQNCSNNSPGYGGAGGIYIYGGTLNLDGGIIRGMRAFGQSNDDFNSGTGGAIAVLSDGKNWPGVFNFKSGQICGNELVGTGNSSNGAAVGVYDYSTFVMSGGTISGNINLGRAGSSQKARGAGVWVENGKMELKGGSIRDNTAGLGSAIVYTERGAIARTADRGVFLSGGQIYNNKVLDALGEEPVGMFSPVYVAGPGFFLEGGGCDVRDGIYLDNVYHHIIVSGDIYQSGRNYKVSLNQSTEATDDGYRKGSVVVAPDGSKKTDATGFLQYFTVNSSPYVLDRGQVAREIIDKNGVQENACLLLMRAVFINGETGDNGLSGSTPSKAVQSYTRAKEVGESGIGTDKDYYIIYVCGQVDNRHEGTPETVWDMASPAYMCRYTGFTVYEEDESAGEVNKAYYGPLVRPSGDLDIKRLVAYGRRSVDSAAVSNGDSLFRIPAGVTVSVSGDAVFGRNSNMGSYFDEDGIQMKLSSEGGAFHVDPDGTLSINSSGARILESAAAYGEAVYLGADAKTNQTGQLLLDGSPSVGGSVFLDGSGTGTTSALVSVNPGYVPAAGTTLPIVLRDDYNGRACVKYLDGTPGQTEMDYFTFDDSVKALYDVIYRSSDSRIIELNQKKAIYLDGVNGSDEYDGSTPEKAFKTLKKVYQSVEGQALDSEGIAVYVVNTVTLNGVEAPNATLNNIQYIDPATGLLHYKGYYQDDNTPQINVDGQVYFKRYSKPSGFTEGDLEYEGYNRETNRNALIHVTGEQNLSLWGIYLDGHSQSATSDNKLYAADAVEALAPLVLVDDHGFLDCQYAAGSGDEIGVSTVFLNNKNVNKKDKKIGEIKGSDGTMMEIFEGSAAGIEILDEGICDLKYTQFRNLSLGANVVSGGTDVYHNGQRLGYHEKTRFEGSVFLEGMGTADDEASHATSKYMTALTYGTPTDYHFQVLMRDPYNHRTVAKFPSPDNDGPSDRDIGYLLLEERVKEFFFLSRRENEITTLELLVPSGVYIDYANGNDDSLNTAAGSNPKNPVQTLQRAYELLKTRGGNTICVVGTIQIETNTEITGTRYVAAGGTNVNLGSTDKVNIVRYIQPDFAKADDADQEAVVAAGYDVEDFTGPLINVKDGCRLTVGSNVFIDGHSEPKTGENLPKEFVVAGSSTSYGPLVTVEDGAGLTLNTGCELRNNNNVFDSSISGTHNFEGGAIHNLGNVTVSGGAFLNNHAKKGDAAYQSGIFLIEMGVENIKDHSFYLASENRGTAEAPIWGSDYTLDIAEKVPDGQTFKIDMDHPVVGRDVIEYTSPDGYAPADGADAEYVHYELGDTVPEELFLVEAATNPQVLELQDWKILSVEVPADIYLVMTQRQGMPAGSARLKAVKESDLSGAEIFSTPEYQIANNGQYDVKVSVNGLSNMSAETDGASGAGLPGQHWIMKTTPMDVLSEDDIYLGIAGTNGLTLAETALYDGSAYTPVELGHLNAGSAGGFVLTGAVGSGFVSKYQDTNFPLSGSTPEAVQDYMDLNGYDGLTHAAAKYLLKYKVEIDPPRRTPPGTP